MSEVNFSDRTPRKADPHTWIEKAAQVVCEGRILCNVPVWLCERCQAVSTLPPRFLRSDGQVIRACEAAAALPC